MFWSEFILWIRCKRDSAEISRRKIGSVKALFKLLIYDQIHYSLLLYKGKIFDSLFSIEYFGNGKHWLLWLLHKIKTYMRDDMHVLERFDGRKKSRQTYSPFDLIHRIKVQLNRFRSSFFQNGCFRMLSL